MTRGGEKEVKKKTREVGQKRWRDSLSRVSPGAVGWGTEEPGKGGNKCEVIPSPTATLSPFSSKVPRSLP